MRRESRYFNPQRGLGFRPRLLDVASLFMCIPAVEGTRPMNAVAEAIDLKVREKLGGRSVVFVGLMGAGKTAIGRRVAQMLGMPFIDSDHEIETVSRMSVPDLFELYGEPEFRSLERRVISRLVEEGGRIVSTGGGAFMNEETRSAIAANAVSVWLKADLDVLMERVSKNRNRPLLRNPDPVSVMQRLMKERYPVYALADVTVLTRDETKEIIAAETIAALARHLEGPQAARDEA